MTSSSVYKNGEGEEKVGQASISVIKVVIGCFPFIKWEKMEVEGG